MTARALADFAEKYASGLTVGCEILIAQDWEIVAPVFEQITRALWRRGLRLERRGVQGWVVKALEENVFSDFQGNEEPTIVACKLCHQPWAVCPHVGEYRFFHFDESAVIEPRRKVFA